MGEELPGLFDYAITPRIVAAGAAGGGPSEVDFLITAHNGGPGSVRCSRLVFTLPVGTEGMHLTGGAAEVHAAAARGTPWSIAGDGSGSFAATPDAPGTGLGPGETIGFTLSGVRINGAEGVALLTVDEESDGARRASLQTVKGPPGLAIVCFTADAVEAGEAGPVTLAWRATGARQATLSWRGHREVVPVEGSFQVSPERTTEFRLTVTDGEQILSQSLTVWVERVRIAAFTAEPACVAPGKPVTLSWAVFRAQECGLEPGHASVPPEGTLEVCPQTTSDYVLTGRSGPFTDAAVARVEVSGN
jgi:hypothetical protein